MNELKLDRSSPTTPLKPIIYFIADNGCWEIISHAAGRCGYISLSIKKKNQLLHRLVWSQYRGVIPKGMQVCHSCDNKLCVNPDHLFLGTPLDNMRDKIEKGRHVAVVGEKHGMSKLTADEVRQIRILKGSLPQRIIANQFGVSQALISLILNNRNWNYSEERL